MLSLVACHYRKRISSSTARVPASGKSNKSALENEKSLREGWEPEQALLDAFGIEKEWLMRWPNELSGGELQRFCVVRALGPKTRFLIADEMTTMLDAITQAQIWHAVLEIAKKRNMGVIVISHEEKLIERLCDRVITLSTSDE